MSEVSDQPVPHRHWWLPSLGVCIWLAFFLGLTLSNWRQVLVSADGDPCLHWRIGNWMIEHGAVLRTEQFSHTRMGAPLISKEWLSEILFAAAGNLLGWNGAVLLSALLIATTLWLLYRRLLADGCEILLATGLVMVAAAACSVHWLARPHLTTHLLTVVFTWQLARFDRDELSTRRLFACLLPLMLLWANLHGAFFTGFVLIGIYLAGGFLALANCPAPRRPPIWSKIRTLTLLTAACLLVSFINPNGWTLHAHVLSFLRTPALAGFTNEFRSPNFHSGGTTGFLLELALLGILLVAVRPRLSPIDLLMISVWGYFALHSARNVPIFALVVTPILATHFNASLRAAPESRFMSRFRAISNNVTELQSMAGGRALVVAACVAVLLVMVIPHHGGGQPILTTEILTNRFPVAAVRFLQSHADLVRGQMFNEYAWGGYLMLVMPERKVFIDGRNDFYGEALIREFNEVDDLKPGWERVFEKYRVDWTILPPKHGLTALLALRADWKRVYADDVAVIYTRR